MFEAFKLADGTFAGFGHHVINLTSIRAVIVGQHFDGNGNRSPILRELIAPGVLSRAQWVADAAKCRSAFQADKVA